MNLNLIDVLWSKLGLFFHRRGMVTHQLTGCNVPINRIPNLGWMIVLSLTMAHIYILLVNTIVKMMVNDEYHRLLVKSHVNSGIVVI
jgi:hypothetical protein